MLSLRVEEARTRLSDKNKYAYTSILVQYLHLDHIDLSGKSFRDIQFLNCRFNNCNFNYCNIYQADFKNTIFYNCSFHGTKFQYIANLPKSLDEQLTITPEGDLIVYKKAWGRNYAAIVTLLIPKKAKRCSATGRKCRAEYAKVLKIESERSGRPVKSAHSEHDTTFKYEVGKIVRPRDSFELDRWKECAPGIHFYLTRGEAERH